MIEPKRLKILGKYYAIVPTTEGDYGEANVTTCEIQLLQTQDEQQRKDTLLHEAIHAIDDTMHLNLSERQVHALAGGIYALLHDNRLFAKWLISKPARKANSTDV